MQLPFAFDSSEILEAAKSRLDALGVALQSPELLNERYIVSGHTDSAGRIDYNIDLSKKRAEAVKAYLVGKHGIATTRIVPIGKGSSELIDPSDPRAAANRRVMIEGLQ
jgi:OmpA-OmpF porin, OOP family